MEHLDRWSADGKRIAYVKTGGPLGDALMAADADGQNEVELVKRRGAGTIAVALSERSVS